MKMKKRIFTILTLVSIIILSSCSMDAKGPENDNGRGQSSVDKTTYVVPFFATDKTAVQSETRGITHMPTGSPWGDDPMRSASVMQSLPAMIGFESIEKDSFENVKTEADEKGIIHLLGFDVRPETGKWKENDDGIYLCYTIIYENTDVGIIEYYYNDIENVFSYRQMVMLTMMMDEARIAEAIILTMEYDDIPVASTNETGSFRFGQLVNDEIEKNAFVDHLYITTINSQTGQYNNDGIMFNRTYMTGVSSSDCFYSFCHPDLTEATYPFDHTDIYNVIENIENGNKNEFLDTADEAKAADAAFMMDIAEYIYSKARSVETAGPYDSYDDFMASSLKELCGPVEEQIENRENGFKEGRQPHSSANPVIFSWKDYKSAAAQTTQSGMEFNEITAEIWPATDFGDFYKDIKPDGMSDDDLVKALINAHLRACGIENGNYIENYSYAETYKHGMGIWPVTVTTEDPDVFREKYDKAVDDFYTGSGISPVF